MSKCPICKQDTVEITDFQDGQQLNNLSCKVCGSFKISKGSSVELENTKEGADFYLLSGYLRNRTKSEKKVIGTANYKEIIKIASQIAKGFENEDDILDKILIHIYQESMRKRSNAVSFYIPHDYPLFYLKSPEDFGYYIHFLVNPLNYLKHKDKDYSLTKEGFERVKEIKYRGGHSNKVFVAMAFSKETEAFREVLKNVIKETRYDLVIVDEEHFTGNIVDYILTQIKEAKFVISDFTFMKEEPKPENGKIKGGVRGGVYYEAGFAKGLGLQVIHTCKDDEASKQRIHFDITQENTIFWNDDALEKTEIRSDEERQKGNSAPQNFSEQLYDRIKFIFGLGKNISE